MEKTQMLKGILEGCILEIIHNENTYGYGILEILKKHGFSEITEGTIYPLLIRLEKQEVLLSELRHSPLGPKRKYYTLSEKGQRERALFLCEWEQLRNSVDALRGGEK